MSNTEPRYLLGWLVGAPSIPGQALERSSPGSCPPGCEDRVLDHTALLHAVSHSPFTLSGLLSMLTALPPLRLRREAGKKAEDLFQARG